MSGASGEFWFVHTTTQTHVRTFPTLFVECCFELVCLWLKTQTKQTLKQSVKFEQRRQNLISLQTGWESIMKPVGELLLKLLEKTLHTVSHSHASALY